MTEPAKKELESTAGKGENPDSLIEKVLITLLTTLCTNLVKMLSTWLSTDDNVRKWLGRNGPE